MSSPRPGIESRSIAGDIVVTPAVGNNKTIPATALRRVHVYGDGYRIVYVDDDQIKILEGASFPNGLASQFRATSSSMASHEHST